MFKKTRIIFLIFFIFFLADIKLAISENEKFLYMYPFSAKELVFECESWIPNETAEQQKHKREVPCIRYIQSVINTYQTIQESYDNIKDLCIPPMLNIHRQKDLFISYVKKNPDKENHLASKIVIESIIENYCK